MREPGEPDAGARDGAGTRDRRAGGVLGLVLGYGMMLALKWITRTFSLPQEADVRIDFTILLFTLAISVLTGILFGLAPAFHATRVALTPAMNEGGRSGTAGTGRWSAGGV
jgi:putative ABC transport system permease protein